MIDVMMNGAAVVAAAAEIEVFGEAAILAHLGVALAPATPELMAAVVRHLPISISQAFAFWSA